jgi:hypothetical protein
MVPWAPLHRGGSVQLTEMYGPAGLVGPVGSTDHPYVGMDPSDPVTWTRPYNPQPGMIAQLNFDGAYPNSGQVISGPAPRRRRRRRT